MKTKKKSKKNKSLATDDFTIPESDTPKSTDQFESAVQTPVAKPAVTATTKIATPVKSVKHIKKSRHTGKQVRNIRHGKVAHVNAKRRTAAIKSTGHVVKGPRLAAHRAGNISAVR